MDQNLSIELKNTLRNKFVIFDTNILLEASKSIEPFFDLFQIIKEADCVPIYFPLIEFEFLRTTYQEELKQKKKDFLEEMSFERIPINPLEDVILDAIEISNIFTARKMGSPELTDCCIGALLKKYGDKLLLVSRNHKHFNTIFYDRVATCAVELDNNVMALGFYKYNKGKAKKMVSKK